ncbi:MAG: TAXI family TRAP transporter solute-binding subunit [Pseudomonadota bacterium]
MSFERRALVLGAVCAAALTAFAGTASAQQVRLMTGPQGGSWYPLGGAIQSIAEREMGLGVQVLPGAGIANVKALQAGRADIAFANSVSTVEGINGKGAFAGEPTPNVCNVGTLYPQFFQVVANADGPASIAEMEGTSLAAQPRGNTAEAITADLLAAYDMTYDDMGRVNFGSYTDAVALMKDGNADVFTLGTTVPAGAVMDLASARDIRVLEIDDEGLARMQEINPGYQRIMIPAESYPGQDEAVPTIGYSTHIIARCDLDADVVYGVLAGIAGNVDDMAAVARAMANATPESMAVETGVPLHDGARRFYEEQGVL